MTEQDEGEATGRVLWDKAFWSFFFYLSVMIVCTGLWLLANGQILFPADLLSWMYPFHGTEPFRSVEPFLPNRGYQDVAYVSYQGILTTGWAVGSGSLPLWNPLEGAGQPQGGLHGVGAWFPLRWVTYSWLSPLTAWHLESAIQFLVTGSGAFLLFRLVTGSVRAATLGALAWTLAGWHGAYFWQTTHAWPAAFLCWTYYGLEQTHRGRHWGVLLTSTGTMLILVSGHLQQSVQIALGVTIYWIFRPTLQKIPMLLSLVAGVLMALPHLVPLAELLLLSERPEIPTSVLLEQLLTPRELIGLMVQNFAGQPSDGFYVGRTMASLVNDPREHALYVGQLMFLLSLFGLTRLKDWRHRGLGVVMGLGLLVASNPAVYGLILAIVPPLKFLTPTRYLTTFVFLLCYFGSQGFASWEKCPPTKREWGGLLTVVALFVISCLSFAWPATTAPHKLAEWFLTLARKGITKPPYFEGSFGQVITERFLDHYSLLSFSMWFPLLSLFCFVAILRFTEGRRRFGLLVAVSTLDLLVYFFSMNTPVAREQFFPQTPEITRLMEGRTLEDGVGSRILSMGRGMHPNVPLSYGIANLESYQSVHPGPYREIFTRLNRGGLTMPHQLASTTTAENLFPGTLDILGVGCIYNQPTAGTTEGNLLIRERSTALRAFLTDRWRTADPQAILDTVYSKDFQPVESVLLEEQPDFESASPGFFQKIQADRYDWNSARFSVQTPAPCLLVLTDLNYPGWRARINGQETKILQAYGFARAVELPTGQSTVEFQFRPTGFYLSLTGAFLGLLLSLGVAWRIRLSRKLHEKEAK